MNRPFVSIFLPTLNFGGAEKTLIELANGIQRHDRRVHLLTMSAGGPLRDSVAPGVEIVDLACTTFRKAVPALSRYYDKVRPELVLTSLYATGLAAIAARAMSRYKPAVVVGAHNSLRAKVARPDNRKDKYFLLPLCLLLIPRADGLVAVSNGVANELRQMLKLPQDKVRVIYNPVISPQLIAQSGASVEHPWLVDSVARPFKTLISVGRLVEQKAFDVLLKAFARVRHHEDCRLLLVGDGPLRGELEMLAERLGVRAFVDFVGLQENPYKFISRADLFVLSSRWEGLANVLIEALACGCAVVATNCNYGPNEILQGGRYGPLVQVDDPDALAAAIVESLGASLSGPGDKVARRARALDFSVETAVAQYVDFFSKVIAGSVSPVSAQGSKR